MSLLEAIILGIIQGISEFIPISSSGHLVLFQSLFKIKEPTMTFDILLHMGTLIPIFIVYRNQLFKLIKNPFQKLTFLLAVGTIPAVILALLFKDTIETLFSTAKFLAVGFTLTGILLLLADKKPENGKLPLDTKKTDDITYLDALLIGCMQGVAIAPGISRSGSTVAASIFRKLDRETAAQFSFLLSIPAILGAIVLEAIKLFADSTTVTTASITPLTAINPVYIAAGVLASSLSGYLAINFMLKLIKNAKLKYFAIYVFLLAIFILVDTFILEGKILTQK